MNLLGLLNLFYQFIDKMNLSNLPNEILSLIAENLEGKDILAFERVSKLFRLFCFHHLLVMKGLIFLFLFSNLFNSFQEEQLHLYLDLKVYKKTNLLEFLELVVCYFVVVAEVFY
jgi:hypothetical protein